jgi:hypothetical protein
MVQKLIEIIFDGTTLATSHAVKLLDQCVNVEAAKSFSRRGIDLIMALGRVGLL